MKNSVNAMKWGLPSFGGPFGDGRTGGRGVAAAASRSLARPDVIDLQDLHRLLLDDDDGDVVVVVGRSGRR